MSLRHGLFSAISLLLLPISLCGQGSRPLRQTVIRAARLFDGRTDSVIPNAVILIEDNKIKSVGAGTAMPASARLIDLGDATLLPGLIDAHTHLLMELDEAKN